MSLRKFVRKLGFKRIYNPHSYQLEYYFGGKKLFEIFDKKSLPNILEENRNALLNQIYVMQNILPDIHMRTFAKYRDSFKDRDVVLMANGPTLNRYTQDRWMKNSIHIGVNKVIDFMELDYYFAGDWTGISRYGVLNKILRSNAKIFFAISGLSDEYGTTSFATPLDFIKKCDASMFFSMHYASHQIIQPDITKHPLFGHGSCIHAPFHFALYCRPKRIYLIGCDVSQDGHFNDASSRERMHLLAQQRLKEEWRRMAQFAHYYYPDVEIISVNPIGLKGMFHDIYF